ncbi:MAG: hypothetical protein AABX02_01600, partial [archaeon]
MQRQFDLFQLHDHFLDNSPKKWICADREEVWSEVNELIHEIMRIRNISQRDLSRLIAKKIKISIVSSDRLVYGRKDWFPIVFMELLLELSNQRKKKWEIIEKISHLKVSQPPLKIVRTPKYLNSNLCKIAGAHTADGTLSKSYFCITDGDKLNLVAFQKWLHSEFGLNMEIHGRSENEWAIRFSNKIFARYLNKLFKFPNGKKFETTGIPEIIKHSNKDFRTSFAIGAMGFEAGLGASPEVSLCVLSKKFRDDLAEILKENNIPFVLGGKSSSTYWRFWSGNLQKEKAQEWIKIFEPNTEKWYKLNDLAFGFTAKVNSYDEAIKILEGVYPKNSSNKVITAEVLSVIKEMDEGHRYKIADTLASKNGLKSYGGKWGHSLRHHLDILKETKMIKVRRERF